MKKEKKDWKKWIETKTSGIKLNSNIYLMSQKERRENGAKKNIEEINGQNVFSNFMRT